jgi:hypothetical protein
MHPRHQRDAEFVTLATRETLGCAGGTRHRSAVFPSPPVSASPVCHDIFSLVIRVRVRRDVFTSCRRAALHYSLLHRPAASVNLVRAVGFAENPRFVAVP